MMTKVGVLIKLAMITLVISSGLLVSCTFGAFESGRFSSDLGSFAITAATAGDQQVILHWEASSAATGYTIQYGTTPGNYTESASAAANSPYTVTGLTNGNTYYFMVQASNPLGVRNAEAEVSAMPIVLPSAPLPTLDIAGESSWDLAWPAVDGTGPITYSVARTSTFGSGYSDLPSCLNTASATCSDTTIAANSTYCYKVTATNAGGSATSPEICPELTVSPSLTLSTNNDIALPARGGAPPLNYSIDSGPGTINPSTGVYTTTQSGPATIKVTDAQNNSQTITINNKKIRFDGAVRAVAQAGTSLYVGGDFTLVNPIDAPKMLVLDLNGKPKYGCDLQSGFDGDLTAVIIAGKSLYVGGYFTQYRGQSANYLAKLNLPSCELDTTFSPPEANGFDYEVYALAVSGSSLYVGGYFNSYRSGEAGSANGIAKLDLTTGALDTTFSPPGANGFDDFVSALAVSGTSLYVGGYFSAYKGVANSANRIAKLDLNTGALDTTFSPPGANGFDHSVYALAVSGSSLYVGGHFSAYRGVANSAKNIAKLDLTTGALDTTFSPPGANGFNYVVNALAVSGTSLYVGGWFTSYKGVANSAKNIAKLDLTTGALDTTFSPPGANGFDHSVYALAVSGSSLYVGGYFNDYRGVANSANRIAKLDLTTGALDTTFNPPGANGFNNYSSVNALAVSGTSLYVGGNFTTYRGSQNARYLVPLNLDTGDLGDP